LWNGIKSIMEINNKKRILILNYEFPPLGGGASPVSYEIAERLSKTGDFDIDVVTMGYKDLPKYEEINSNFRIHRVKCLRSKKELCHPWEQATYLISAWFKCNKLIKKEKYDICHCHFIIPTGVLALKLKKKFNLDYVVTSHGSDVPGHNTDRFKFLHKFTGPILRKICKMAKSITVPSHFLKDLILKNIDHNINKKIIVLPSGSKDFARNDIEKENIILSVGRMHEGKGFQYLIEAFKKIDSDDWKLYLVGNGPYKKILEKMAEGDENIIFTGWIDNKGEKFIELINKAKVFSLLSAFESQGIVYLEAMSAGCSILASNINACKETASDDIGYLVQRDNVNKVELKLRRLMDDKTKLDFFMNNSRKRYEEKYNWDKIIEEYKKIITDLSI